MTIHHATQKKADAEGITLTETEDVVVASFGERVVKHASAKTALVAAILAKQIAAEYPAIRFGNDEIEDTGWVAIHDSEPFVSYDEVPDLATVLDDAVALGIDPEEGFEDEPDQKVVVAQKYKQRYAAGGHPAHCGDWLANLLEGAFIRNTADGDVAFDTDEFAKCLVASGVEITGKWADLPTSGQHGWVGRYRMNGRQKLEHHIAEVGFLMLHGEQVDCPEEALAALRAKHPKAVKQVEKVEEAA